jgi:hypothetical protein
MVCPCTLVRPSPAEAAVCPFLSEPIHLQSSWGSSSFLGPFHWPDVVVFPPNSPIWTWLRWICAVQAQHCPVEVGELQASLSKLLESFTILFLTRLNTNADERYYEKNPAREHGPWAGSALPQACSAVCPMSNVRLDVRLSQIKKNNLILISLLHERCTTRQAQARQCLAHGPLTFATTFDSITAEFRIESEQ